MERSGLTIEHFCLETVENRRAKKSRIYGYEAVCNFSEAVI